MYVNKHCIAYPDGTRELSSKKHCTSIDDMLKNIGVDSIECTGDDHPYIKRVMKYFFKYNSAFGAVVS